MHFTKLRSHGNSYKIVLWLQKVYWSSVTTVNIHVFTRSIFVIAPTYYCNSAVFWNKNHKVS